MKSEPEKGKPSLEELFDQLEEVTGELEDDTLPLEEAFQKYQKGMELLKACNESIDQVEQQLQIMEEQ